MISLCLLACFQAIHIITVREHKTPSYPSIYSQARMAAQAALRGLAARVGSPSGPPSSTHSSSSSSPSQSRNGGAGLPGGAAGEATSPAASSASGSLAAESRDSELDALVSQVYAPKQYVLLACGAGLLQSPIMQSKYSPWEAGKLKQQLSRPPSGWSVLTCTTQQETEI